MEHGQQNNRPTDDDVWPKFRISEAIVLGVITVLGYYYAYRYESGYLSYFGVNSGFVVISLETIFNVFVGSFMTVWGLFVLYHFMKTILSSNLKLLLFVSRWFLPWIIVALASYKITGFSVVTYIFIGIAIISTYITLGPPLFRKDGTYFEKLLKSEEAEREGLFKLFGPYMKLTGRVLWNGTLLCLFLAPVLFSGLGKSRFRKS